MNFEIKGVYIAIIEYGYKQMRFDKKLNAVIFNRQSFNCFNVMSGKHLPSTVPFINVEAQNE